MATAPQIKNKVLVSKDTLYKHRRFILNGQVAIAAGATRDFSAATILGADASKYDMDKLEVQVMVLDNEVGSPTINYYIESSGVCVVGIKNSGDVRIVNVHTAELTYWVRIIAHLKEV